MAKSAPVKYEVRWRQTGTVQWGPISSIDPTAEIVVEGLDRTKSYDFEVRAVSSCGARSAWVSSSQTLADVPPGNLTLSDIKTEVDNAAADALAANQELANIASDNVLSQGEKPVVIRDTNVITTEQAGIDAQATAFGVTSEKTAYDNAVTALTTYLATLTTPVLWSNLTGDTTIVGTTFRQKFADVYTTRQALLNAIYGSAKAKADAAQSSADVAGSGVPAYNPVFKNDLSGWTFDTAGSGEWYREAGGNSPDASEATYLVHKGVAGQTTTCAHNTGGGIAVKTGQTVTALVALRSIGANAGSRAYVRIGWYNSAGAEITNSTQGVTICTPDAGTNYFSQGVSRVYGTAPANAVRALVEIEFDNHTSGYFTATSAWIAHGTQSADEVPESDVRKWAAESGADVTAGKSLDVLADGSTYARVRKGQLNNGVIALLNTGRNCISNPTFNRSANAYPNGALLTTAGYLVDGWQVSGASSLSGGIPYNGALYVRTYGGFPINGSTVNSGITYTCNLLSDNFAVKGGAPFAIEIGRTYGSSGSLPAGVTAFSRVYVRFLDSAGNGTTNSDLYDKAWNYAGKDRYTGTIPAGSSQAQIIQYIYFVNTGAGTTLPASSFFDTVLTSIDFVYQTSLADEVNGTLSTQRNLPLVTWGNYGGGWSGLSINYTTTTTSCTFTASSGSYVGGGDSIAYNSGSVTVSGTAGSTVTYYLYYDDPTMTGGSKTLQATTNQITSLNAAGRVLLGKATVTYPTSGTGSGGGGTGCPQVDEPVIRRAPDGSEEVVRAGDTRVGDYLLLSSGRWGFVSYSETKLQPGVRVVGSDGSTITCSASAPLETVDGTCVCAPHVRDLFLKHRRAGGMLVAEVLDAGEIWVQHITCEDDCFWVGDYSHHNLKPIN